MPTVDARVPKPAAPLPGRVLAWVQRTLALALAWWLVVEARPDGWWFALLVIVAIVSVHGAASGWQPWRPRPTALLRFAVYFLVESVRGGVDVAWRALQPRMPIAPDLVTLPLRLGPGPARTLLTITVSLLPGTLAVSVGSRHITLHVIDRQMPAAATLRRLEHHAAAVYGTALADGDA